MRNALVIASVASMIDQFNMQNIALLKELGYRVDVACNFLDGNTCNAERIKELKKKLETDGVGCFQIDFARNVLQIGQNVRAYWQLKNIAKKKKYSLVHCHAPIGGVLGRMVFHKYRKIGTRVLYTAHGFHFYKGAPLKNWLFYYSVEKFLSRWTDCLITINREDYCRAKRKFHAKQTEYVPGVGIDLGKIAAIVVDRDEKRKEIGVPDDAYMILSVGELSERKNHRLVLEALCGLKDENIFYVICGQGKLEQKLKEFAKEHGLVERVGFLGYRTDVIELCKAADLFAFPSLQEGLPVALMEAMASGVSCIASDIRGNRDLFGQERKYLLPTNQSKSWENNIRYFMKRSKNEIECVEKKQREMIAFSRNRVMKKIRKLYNYQ